MASKPSRQYWQRRARALHIRAQPGSREAKHLGERSIARTNGLPSIIFLRKIP